MVAPRSNAVDLLLDPFTDCLTPEVADRIGQLALSTAVHEKLSDFATRSIAGTLDSQEQAEYRELVELIDLVAIVQAKARNVARLRS